MAWDSNLYLKYENERTQPVKDLISRLSTHKTILDIGSGPGNSTNELKKEILKNYKKLDDNSYFLLMPRLFIKATK